MLCRKIREEYESLQNQIKQIHEELDGMPEGKLLCTKNKNHFKWYVSDGHKKEYIPKKNRAFAEKLAAKKYLMRKLEYLEHEKRALGFYLRHHSEWPDWSEEMLNVESGYYELLSAKFRTKRAEHERWMNEPYERNMKYPENLIHRTSSGILVRSKSEALIELFLHTNRIPFRYECALVMNHITMYPDFTILHPETGKLYYWEHFGRMDDLSYVQRMSSKLQLYASGGIVPSIQLITTYETKNNPLSYDDVCDIGSQYFL